ncbi:azaleucine resistance protein AzlC [Martelella alba]|uniref:Azaleucine resistance protein AzlC n=2 Tax=Martelella alba TaxID=2590451 RepID=A0ABY2SE09_9HYPH|nr:azaleucine resistance protein AzlC [Martelella alba]
MTQTRVRWDAIRASLPIVTGYLPIAFAFGMAGVVNGLPPSLLLGMSAFIFAGASQFVLLAAIHSGTSWLLVLGLCALMDARHLLYGAVLLPKLPDGLRRHLVVTAFTLTDEVFATALVRMSAVEKEQRNLWMGWLGLSSYLSWLVGTALGAFAGVGLSQRVPLLAQAMPFALPALFIVLVHKSFNRASQLPIVISALVASFCYLQGMTALALLAGAVCGCGAVLIRSKYHGAVV